MWWYHMQYMQYQCTPYHSLVYAICRRTRHDLLRDQPIFERPPTRDPVSFPAVDRSARRRRCLETSTEPDPAVEAELRFVDRNGEEQLASPLRCSFAR